jgi:hypothetical protein
MIMVSLKLIWLNAGSRGNDFEEWQKRVRIGEKKIGKEKENGNTSVAA